MKVLVVDDEAPMRQLVQRFLSQDFYLEFSEANDGATALEMLLRSPVDAVMLDLRMRIVSGIETLETIRRSQKFSQLPVVIITGQADSAAIAAAVGLGVSAIVTKPFTRESLRERLMPILGTAAKRTVVTAPPRPMLSIAPGQRVLVVDRDPRFSAVLAMLLGRLAEVTQLSNEFVALTRVFEGPRPDVVVIGEVSELSSIESVARKMRTVAGTRPMAIVAAVSADLVDAADTNPLYGAVLVRSLNADVVNRALLERLSPMSLERLHTHPESPGPTELFDWLRSELERLGSVRLQPAPFGTPAEARGVRAEVELTSTNASYLFRVFLPLNLGLRVASSRLRLGLDMVSDENVRTVADEVITEGARKLRDTLAGLRVCVEPGRTRTALVDGHTDPADSAADRAGTRTWLGSSLSHPVVAMVAVRSMGDGRAPRPDAQPVGAGRRAPDGRR